MVGVGGRGAARGLAAEPSEQEVLGVMMRGHDSMMAVLTARQRALQVTIYPYNKLITSITFLSSIKTSKLKYLKS